MVDPYFSLELVCYSALGKISPQPTYRYECC